MYMRNAMKRIYGTIFKAAAFCLCFAFGCGTKQPQPEVEPPKVREPEARTCPGALPGMNIQVTTAIGESNSPFITWVGDAFAIAWWDLRGHFPQVRLLRVDRTGVNRSPAKKIPHRGAAKHQSLAWDGTELNLVFWDDGRVMSARLGSADEEPKVEAESGKMPAAGPWGAAVWVDAGKLMFRSDGMIELSKEGEVVVEPKPVVIARGGVENPQIAFNGKFYAVVWSNSVKGGREILLQRVSPKGRTLGGKVRVSATAGVSRKPVIVWSGSSFAVAWTNAAPSEQNPLDRYRVFFATIPEVGDMPTMTRQLEFQGSADQVALAATGKEFGLAWVGSRKPRGSAVYLQRIGMEGTPLEDTTEVTDGVPLTCGRPTLAWDGNGYGVAWHVDRSQTGSEVFFAYVECGEEVQIKEPEPAEPKAEPDAGAEPVAPVPTDEPPKLKDVFGEKEPADKAEDKKVEDKKAKDKKPEDKKKKDKKTKDKKKKDKKTKDKKKKDKKSKKKKDTKKEK